MYTYQYLAYNTFMDKRRAKDFVAWIVGAALLLAVLFYSFMPSSEIYPQCEKVYIERHGDTDCTVRSESEDPMWGELQHNHY
jgi:hypothetical protein